MSDQTTQDDVARLREWAIFEEKLASAIEANSDFSLLRGPCPNIREGVAVLRRAADAMERLAPVVAAAESIGWNGVDNSKILSQHILDLGEERDRLKAELADAQKAVDDNWVSHQQIVAANNERDRLHEAVKVMRDGIGNLIGLPNWENRCGPWKDIQDAIHGVKEGARKADAILARKEVEAK